MQHFRCLVLLAVGTIITSSQAQSNITYGSVQPVLAEDFPDPSVVEVNGTWFAFATSGNGQNIQVAASPSFIDHQWRLLSDVDVLPDPGPWATNDRNIWGPDLAPLVSDIMQILGRADLILRTMAGGSCTMLPLLLEMEQYTA